MPNVRLRHVWTDLSGKRYWAILCPTCKGHGLHAGRTCTEPGCCSTGYLLKWEGEPGGPSAAND
jgi:hypothetical protein